MSVPNFRAINPIIFKTFPWQPDGSAGGMSMNERMTCQYVSSLYFFAIHPVVGEIFKFGPKWCTD